jgi:hypothetical protein
MLTAMTLALARAAHPQNFNVDYYVAAATIIPVLFVALAVEGNTYKELLASISAASDRWFADRRLGRLLAVLWREILAGLVLAAGLLGEFLALDALQAHSAAGMEIYGTRIALIILVFAVVAGPAVAFFKAGVTSSATTELAPAARQP